MLKKSIYGALGVSASGLVLASLLVSMPSVYVGAEKINIDTEITEDGDFEFWEDEDLALDGHGDGEQEMSKLFNTYHLTTDVINNLTNSNVFSIGRIDPMYYTSLNEDKKVDEGPKFTWEDAEAQTEISEHETIGYDTKAEPGKGGDVLKSVETGDISERFKRYGVLPVAEDVYGISSEFGPRTNPIGNKDKVFHTGLDIWSDNISGKEIYSMLPGVVSYVGNNPNGYGQHIIIDHDGFKTLYAHLTTTPNYKEGDTVKSGDVLGLVGSTGRSTGPHLHLEIEVEGVKINPKPYMSIVGSVQNKNKPKEVYVQADVEKEDESTNTEPELEENTKETKEEINE